MTSISPGLFGLSPASLATARVAAARVAAARVATAGIATSRQGPWGPLVGRRTGQRLARQELAETSFWQRVLGWLARLFRASGNAVPTGWFGLIALAILAVLAISVVIFWVQPRRVRRAQSEAVLNGESMTARDYRRAAERLAAAGDYTRAIVEGVRAIAADLEEREILAPRPGRTADELAWQAGRELPGIADDLRAATRLFDDIRYGDKDGSHAGYQLVSRVDKDVRAARAAAAAAPEPDLAGFGVPR